MNWSEEALAAHYAGLKQPQPGAETPLPAVERSEFSIQEECVKFMQEDGWRALRTDPVSDRGKGKGFGEVGMADYLFLRPLWVRGNRDGNSTLCDSECLWVEFKARKGKLSMLQNIWHRNERARGFLTWIASVDFPASVDGFRTHYEASGLMRRARWW